MTTPTDIEALQAALAAAQARADAAEAEAARAAAQASSAEALIAALRLQIEKLRRVLYGQRSERSSTVVTSNLPFDEWTGVLAFERLTGALRDRLTHHVHILKMNGGSYRLNQSQRRARHTPRTINPPRPAWPERRRKGPPAGPFPLPT